MSSILIGISHTFRFVLLRCLENHYKCSVFFSLTNGLSKFIIFFSGLCDLQFQTLVYSFSVNITVKIKQNKRLYGFLFFTSYSFLISFLSFFFLSSPLSLFSFRLFSSLSLLCYLKFFSPSLSIFSQLKLFTFV